MANSFDENTMNNIKNMVDKGDISGAISQISPEMIESFSKMMNNNTNQTSGNSNSNTYNQQQNKNQNQYQNSNVSYKNNNSQQNANINNSNHNNNTNSNFDFSNIDINTIMKMKSVMEKMNNKNDPSYNLLYSLKPYLRESKQEKLDQYANLLNISKIAEALNNNNS